MGHFSRANPGQFSRVPKAIPVLALKANLPDGVLNVLYVGFPNMVQSDSRDQFRNTNKSRTHVFGKCPKFRVDRVVQGFDAPRHPWDIMPDMVWTANSSLRPLGRFLALIPAFRLGPDLIGG
jgi:hypothetical protein